MAHGIMENDRGYVIEATWHGLANYEVAIVWLSSVRSFNRHSMAM